MGLLFISCSAVAIFALSYRHFEESSTTSNTLNSSMVITSAPAQRPPAATEINPLALHDANNTSNTTTGTPNDSTISSPPPPPPPPPLHTNPNSRNLKVPVRSEQNKYCWTSYNTTDETSDASPLITDCLRLVENISEGGEWSFVSVTQRTLARKETCAFGVETEGVFNGVWVRMGNGDLIDAVWGLVGGRKEGEGEGGEGGEGGQSNKKVGGKGWTVCPEKTNTLGGVIVRWGVYHT
ncbi:putative necrosis-inducing factor-domain-containing protein [Cladorrhinum sp. PSN259]|nr:putative necrosis-inducing factor-domain-containing protein [Cladorrhinum sp. PSN259]